MDEQEVTGQKPEAGSGDLPDGLESVSPESNIASPVEKDISDKDDNASAQVETDNDKDVEQVCNSTEGVTEEISNNESNNVVEENSEKQVEGDGSEVTNSVDDVDNSENVEQSGEKGEEPEVMEVDEVETEPKHNGPQQVEDEREEGSREEPSCEPTQEEEKMDVDETSTTEEGKDKMTENKDEKAAVENESSVNKDVVDNGAEKDVESEDKDPEKDKNADSVQFESAPDTVEISRNESQTLDPFDELLRADTSNTEDKSSQPSRLESSLNDINNDSDFEDHHDATDITDDTAAADDTVDESLAEEANVADVTEGQGADEEVCLIPDTEREISEAEKLKALANKPESTPAVPAPPADSEEKEGESAPITVMKGESADENGDVQLSFSELNSLHEDVDLGEDDAPEYIDQDKEREEGEVEPEATPETLSDNVIQEIVPTEQICLQCSNKVLCKYRLVVESETKHICNTDCLNQFQEAHPDKYTVSVRKVFIKEVPPTKGTCAKCSEEKDCYYKVTSDEDIYICGEECLNQYIGTEKDQYIVTRKRKYLQEINEVDATCMVCQDEKKCSYEIHFEGTLRHVCVMECVYTLQSRNPGIYRVRKKKVIKVKPQAPLMKLKVISNATDKYLDERHKMVAKTPEQVAAARADRDRSFLRTCAQCHAPYLGNDKNLSWETMDFCNESCLGKYQNIHGSHCANCKNEVSITSLGKYCVRFGYDIRQFCCSGCLEEFKKGLKICCYCQRDISSGFEGFLAPVGDKGQFKDFCTQFCVEKFDQLSRNPVPPPVWARCAVCSKEKMTQLEVTVDDKSSLRLCSEPCFAAFKFVNHIFPDQCRWCNKYFERKSVEAYTIYTESATHCFCCKACMNVYISNSRHIVPCNWCKVKKYNFDMIKRTLDNGQAIMMCSLNCLTLYQVSITAVSSRRIKCDLCKRTSQAQYHLTMSDATVRNFCTYQCVMSFQGQYSKAPLMVGAGDAAKQAVPTGAPRRTLNSASRNNSKPSNLKIIDSRSTGGLPVIASVQSLASAPAPAPTTPSPQMSLAKLRSKRGSKAMNQVPERPKTPPPAVPPKPPTPPPPPPPKIYNHIVLKPPPPKEVKNVSTLTKPIMISKGLTCKPNMVSKELQTDSHLERRILIPVPVPIYVPTPMPMFSMPFPMPVPIPLPIPVPVFVPTTRNTANGIMKEIKKIHEKMPTDPFEAELLMMAEMVAGEKKKAESDSDSDDDGPGDDGFSPDGMDANNSAFGEDVLQMALKMATEYEEPAVDLESAMTASTITPSSHPISGLDDANLHHHQMMLLEQQRAAAVAGGMGRKRGRAPAVPSPAPPPVPQPRAKRARRSEPVAPAPPPQPEPVREPVEKPDANMCLKYTFGVNAWKQWVVTKNQEIEKSSIRRKPFKSEILQLTADELNYSLCLFVKEVRKPNGSEYAPDTIYYLVLGIQQYLFENGRIDNIFTDSYYEKFTDCLDEVARKFSVLYNDSQYIVTRVEEEHLWECKQLGAHSPHVLLSTLMFFNTKHFNLVTPEEHMQLSFSHIMKHWKRNPNQPGAAKIPGSRNVLLRFYPPQSALEANSRKKKVYEQQENEENPLRCPVKLYEFYLSKCPESVKTRNDVFYLMPERSCVPDSPVWYSTQALGKEPLSKMLHRVKMVKEINIALLTS